jgi:hypothetical protein
VTVEKGYSWEVGVRQLFAFGSSDPRTAPWKGFVDVAGFGMHFNDMIEFGLDNYVFSNTRKVHFRAYNIPKAQIMGGEITAGLSGSMGSVDVNFSGSLTLINAINPDGEKGLDGKDSLVYELWQTENLRNGRYQYYRPEPGDPLYAQYNRYMTDQPYTLKYRSPVMYRGSFDIGYTMDANKFKHRFGVVVNRRYDAHIVNVDKIFVQQVVPVVRGADAFRTKHNFGANVTDLIVSYTRTNKMKSFGKRTFAQTASFHIFNIFNEEYITIPGTLGAPRSFALQYKFQF